MSGLAVPRPGVDLVPDGWCDDVVVPWADAQTDTLRVQHAVAQVAALVAAYRTLQSDTLELTKAQRYLEVRWGELLGPVTQGQRTDLEPLQASKSLPPIERHRLRQLAANADLVAERIRQATDPDQLTRAALLRSEGHGGRSFPPQPPKPGRYRCIVVDPPWPMVKIEREVRPLQGADLDYPTLTLDQIADEQWVPVRQHADDDCHLYLWVTHRFLPAGLSLLEGWGFRYQCVMTWRKNVGITPFSWMYDTEHVLFATKGSLPLLRNGLRLSFDAPAVGHSIKPDVFYQRVSEASPGPRLDMFPGVEHDGFEPWGLEASHRVSQ